MDLTEVRQEMLRLGSYGRGETGAITRLPFSEAYWGAAKLLRQDMQDCGLDSWIDSVGNVHGVHRCQTPGAKTLYVGSHLDTVREGGLYDGLLGVVAGLACAGELQKQHKTLHCNLHLLATNGEEGNDLGGTFGSRCMMGLLDPDQPGYLNIAGRYGIGRKEIEQARLDTADAAGYLELHIEQGKTLDEAGEDAGIVTGIVGLRRYQITVLGEANHAGTTMMEFRRDAMVAAAKLIVDIDQLVRQYGHQMVATVGQFALFPNSPPVIPGKAEFVLEMRSQETALMDQLLEQIQARARTLTQVEISFAPLVDKAPVHCDPTFVEVMDQVCRRSGIAFRRMSSGATHDGNAFALRMPIGMLFVPSRNGISHNGREFTPWEQVDRGARLLYETVLALDTTFGKEAEQHV